MYNVMYTPPIQQPDWSEYYTTVQLYLSVYLMIIIFTYFCLPPDPTLTVENLFRVMEKMSDGGTEEVWSELIDDTMLEDIISKCSTERELVNSCVDIYVNCNPDCCWEEVVGTLYHEGETAAVEEVRSYLNPRGRFSQWVWFMVERYMYM